MVGAVYVKGIYATETDDDDEIICVPAIDSLDFRAGCSFLLSPSLIVTPILTFFTVNRVFSFFLLSLSFVPL